MAKISERDKYINSLLRINKEITNIITAEVDNIFHDRAQSPEMLEDLMHETISAIYERENTPSVKKAVSRIEKPSSENTVREHFNKVKNFLNESSVCKYCNSSDEKRLAHGSYIDLLIGNVDNRVYLKAIGEDDTEDYYPRYCPECGRFLGEA